MFEVEMAKGSMPRPRPELLLDVVLCILRSSATTPKIRISVIVFYLRIDDSKEQVVRKQLFHRRYGISLSIQTLYFVIQSFLEKSNRQRTSCNIAFRNYY